MTERIIDEAVLQGIQRTCYEAGRNGREVFTVRGAGEEIVRCRDCKKVDIDNPMEDICPMNGYDPDGFCAWGERKDGR